MASLAQLHENGRGVIRDSFTALLLYRQALSAGHNEAAAAVQRLEGEFRQTEMRVR